MTITVYKDSTANAIFVEDANGVQFLNSLQAFMFNPTDTKISVTDLARDIEIFSDTEYSEFVDSNGDTYGSNPIEATNELNAIFQSSGGIGDAPAITSPTFINVVNGEPINYELIANNGVSYEWGDLPSGVSTVDGNIRKLIGAITTNGTYTPTVKAINYFGEDTKTITITVSEPAFANTKSVSFLKNDYLDTFSSAFSNTLSRFGSGSGVFDAWTISLYFKPGTHTGSSEQTIFYYGGDGDNDAHVWLYYKGNEQALYLEYGTDNQNIKIKSPDDALSLGVWKNLILTYNGETTGQSSGSVNDYYSRFGMWINGTQIITENSNQNDGWDGDVGVSGTNYARVGRNGSGKNYMKNKCVVDELAVWASDQTANVQSIYNFGVPHDLSLMVDVPSNWWRMGDGDTYPFLLDTTGFANFIMYNMTVASIVNDVP
jgi:hypothetical protein